MTDANRMRNYGKPSVDLKSEAEVYIVKHALDRLVRRYAKAVETLEARGANGIAWMMSNRMARIKAVWEFVPEGALVCHLYNKEQVDMASVACEGLITELRLSQAVEWDEYTAAMISVLMPLLDRIRIGWKRPAEIPDDVMAQIKAREGGRFWNTTPGDWIELDDSPVDEGCVYAWRSPDFDLVEDFGWIGLAA